MSDAGVGTDLTAPGATCSAQVEAAAGGDLSAFGHSSASIVISTLQLAATPTPMPAPSTGTYDLEAALLLLLSLVMLLGAALVCGGFVCMRRQR